MLTYICYSLLVGQIRWKLKAFMDERGIKPLDVEREAIRLGYDIGKNVIYRVATAGGPKRIDRTTLVAVIAALRSITNESVEIDDVMQFEGNINAN